MHAETPRCANKTTIFSKSTIFSMKYRSGCHGYTIIAILYIFKIKKNVTGNKMPLVLLFFSIFCP
jgi:hypothetical protein